MLYAVRLMVKSVSDSIPVFSSDLRLLHSFSKPVHDGYCDEFASHLLFCVCLGVGSILIQAWLGADVRIVGRGQSNSEV